MKQMVRLTRRQKEEIRNAGEDPEKWGLIEATHEGTLYGFKKRPTALLFIDNAGQARKVKIQKTSDLKNGMKKVLHGAGEILLGIAVSAVFIYMLFFAECPGQVYQPEPRYIRAINSDYLIPADQYDQYLQDRAEFLEQEALYQR